jgi:linoleoyl-CoA desaturase
VSDTIQTRAPSFGRVLSDRVEAGLTEDTMRRAYRRLHTKAVLVGAWYVGSYVCMLLASNWITGPLACISFALATVAVGFNIQHDANHNAFFRTDGSRRLSTANRIAGFSLNAIGGSAKRWIEGHVIQHHAAPNVVGRDHDIELAPFARLAPSQRRRAWHGFQHVYLWGIYAFTSGSIIVSDVSNTIQESFVGDRHGRSPGLRDYASLAASKGAFLLFMVVIPMLFHPWWVVTLGALLVLGVSGFLLGVVFQLAHVVEEADFCDATNRASGRWHEWQVRSSIGFCHGGGTVSRALTWYAGGLNFQTEHHLFPALPHTVYPQISAIVTETCADFGIERRLQPTLRGAVRSHYRHVRRLGQPDPSAGVDGDQAAA